MKPCIDSLERAVINTALAQFRAHLKANEYSAEFWISRLKEEGRSKKTMALIRAVAKLDKAQQEAK